MQICKEVPDYTTFMVNCKYCNRRRPMNPSEIGKRPTDISELKKLLDKKPAPDPKKLEKV